MRFEHTATPTDTDRAELKKELGRAKGVWMPGGVQGRIIERLGKAWCDANVKPLLKKGVNFYGTSAGSMVCSETMIGLQQHHPAKSSSGSALVASAVTSPKQGRSAPWTSLACNHARRWLLQ